ncbi:DUF2254 domain-containing protein [Sphaerotilus sulfidivorans]
MIGGRWFRVWVWLRERQNQIWFVPALGVVGATALALGASLLNHVVPPKLLPEVRPEAIEQLLDIVASSMLAVATFSLGIMVSAFASTSSNATPRATELVMGDDVTRTAIGSFLAAFIYAVVARTALGLNYYGPTGRFVLFVSTLAVLAHLVVTLVRWVRTLSTLGRMEDTLARIEQAAGQALDEHARSPWLAAMPAPDGPLPGRPVASRLTGHVTHVDLAGLQQAAVDSGGELHLRVRPGDFVHRGEALALLQTPAGGDVPDEITLRVAGSVIVARSRTYDQDPRFGLIVLGEVAQRALSPAINDPGTAIQVLGTLTRLLLDWAERRMRPGPLPVRHDRVTVPTLAEADFLFDGFEPIARTGADALEVQIRLQKMLAVLVERLPPELRPEVRALAQRSVRRAQAALPLAEDGERLVATHARLPALQGP